MLAFRQKIVFSHLAIFLVLSCFIFPLVSLTIKHVLRVSMFGLTEQIIEQLKQEPNTDAMIELMKKDGAFIYRPVSLLDGEGDLLYYSALPYADRASVQQIERREPEVIEAMESGRGFGEHISPFFNEKFYFVAMTFNAHGQTYIIHDNFRAQVIDQLIFFFKIAVLILCVLIIGLTTLVDSAISNYILSPVQRIIEKLRPFQEGKEELLPKIILDVEDRRGEFGKLAAILNSLTKRVQSQIDNLTFQREETEAILESLGEGVIAVNRNAEVTFVNTTACQMLEVSKEQILNQTLVMIPAKTELPKESHELLLHALDHSERVIQTLTIRDNSPLFLDLIAAPLAHKTGAVLVLQDKTYAYRIVEVGKDFIANASHELRTPITIIRGFAETLQDIPNLSEEMLHEITEKIVRTCIRLEKLVRSLLTLSDIEHIPQERLQAADLLFSILKCKDQLLALNPDAKVAIRSAIETAPVFVDVDLIELAITNILENAVKYSPKDAEIEMMIERLGEAIQLSIKDKGIGISDSDLPHVFDRFYTVDKARSRKSGGAGLGLSIVKKVIEMHKGKVSASSEIGKGTTFTIVLPMLKK